MTRFEIMFFNPNSKERRTVEVMVTSEETRQAAAYPDPQAHAAVVAGLDPAEVVGHHEPVRQVIGADQSARRHYLASGHARQGGDRRVGPEPVHLTAASVRLLC